jgi:hypothetical protein
MEEEDERLGRGRRESGNGKTELHVGLGISVEAISNFSSWISIARVIQGRHTRRPLVSPHGAVGLEASSTVNSK